MMGGIVSKVRAGILMLLRDVNSLARTLPVIHKKLALLSIILILMLDVFATSLILVANVMLLL
jgi:hypothetical protein